MSHLHIPDGVITPWLWILGYIITAVFLLFCYKHLKNSADYKKIAIVSVIGALMLLTMSIPVPFIIPYHINLTALTGILIGPLYAGLSILVVNIILALIGHGGVTIIGLNAVILIIEAGIAFFGFRLLQPKLKRIFPAAFIATYAALVVSTALTVGVVYAGTQDLDHIFHDHHDHNHSQYLIPQAHAHSLEHHYEHNHFDENHSHDHTEECSHHNESFDITRFLALILIAGLLGWTLEAFITAFIIKYISRVKPDLLFAENKPHENI